MIAGYVTLALLVASEPAPEPPFAGDGHPVTSDVRVEQPRERSGPAPFAHRAYQALTRFDGPRCPHRPSCSGYAREAVRRHGAVLGGFITVGRLLRGSRSSALRPLPRDADGRLLDPLEDSTFFLLR